MKRTIFLAAFVCLLAVSAFAQDKKATDFSGGWTLDVSRSKLGERARIESMTMTVAQTDKDIKIETATKRLQPADAAGGMGRGGMRGGFGGDINFTYTLDGKETTVTQETQMGAIPVKLKAEPGGDGTLKLSSSRTLNTPNGEITMTTKETWTLSEDGKTLTVKRDTETPRGTNSSEMVFTKK